LVVAEREEGLRARRLGLLTIGPSGLGASLRAKKPIVQTTPGGR
jgi:hypothetical protein